MRTRPSFALLITLFLTPSGIAAQEPPEVIFDWGRISASPSAAVQSYYDVTHGFRFEFPAGWKGTQGTVADPSETFSSISVNPLFAAHDRKFYISEGANASGTKAINGVEWTALTWPDGRRGYYTHKEGLAIEFVAETVTRTGVLPSAGVLATLGQVLSSFTFVNDSSRLDRQIAALRTSQKLGGLTIKNLVAGTGGFSG